jgi:ketosteroid isomerase-like protein
MPDTNTDVRETLNDFFRTVEAMDLDRVATFFEEDAQMFSPLGTYPARLDGRVAILAQFKAIADAIKQMPAPLKIDPQQLVVREFGDLALVTFHLNLPGGGPLHRRSFLLRRTNVRWQIVHIHASAATPT